MGRRHFCKERYSGPETVSYHARWCIFETFTAATFFPKSGALSPKHFTSCALMQFGAFSSLAARYFAKSGTPDRKLFSCA